MQISIQTDNHKYRKSVATKKSIIFKKMGLKFHNPKFNFFAKKHLFCLYANFLDFRGQYSHSETSKSGIL